jgi:hypothetical protein
MKDLGYGNQSYWMNLKSEELEKVIKIIKLYLATGTFNFLLKKIK